MIELEREAARATRQPAAYTDVTVSFSKSISILHASIRENARRARFCEVLYAANRAVLEYAQRWAAVTRTGYHGARVSGCEPGRFEPATLVVSSWLQGHQPGRRPQDHVHNQIARMVRTSSDCRWRAPLTREFGVEWVPRADGRGNEIRGITRAQMDAYSTRTVAVRARERELALEWERRHGAGAEFA